MRGSVFALGMAIGLFVATQSAHAVNCGPIVDGAAKLSAQARKATDRMLAVPMYEQHSIKFSAARCATERRVIAAWRKELAYMRSHPECYSEKDTETTQRFIRDDTDDLKHCR